MGTPQNRGIVFYNEELLFCSPTLETFPNISVINPPWDGMQVFKAIISTQYRPVLWVQGYERDWLLIFKEISNSFVWAHTQRYVSHSQAQSQHRGRTHAQQGCTLQLAKAQRAKISHCPNKRYARKGTQRAVCHQKHWNLLKPCAGTFRYDFFGEVQWFTCRHN